MAWGCGLTQRARRDDRAGSVSVSTTVFAHNKGSGSPHPRAVGRTFEFTIPLPKPQNAVRWPQKDKQPPVQEPIWEPTVKKPSKKATPKAKQTERHPEPNPRKVKARAENGRKYEQKRPQTPERKELQRRSAQVRRAEAKSLGLCRDCRKPAIHNQTRCEVCRDKHNRNR